MFPGINNLNPEELAVVKWQYRLGGDFFRHLWEAIALSDKANLAKIEAGFPVEVAGYRKYISERGWWENVQVKLEGEGALRSPAFWARKWNLVILDADGWRDKGFNEPITEKEFFDRASDSTCTGNMECFEEYKRKKVND